MTTTVDRPTAEDADPHVESVTGNDGSTFLARLVRFAFRRDARGMHSLGQAVRPPRSASLPRKRRNVTGMRKRVVVETGPPARRVESDESTAPARTLVAQGVRSQRVPITEPPDMNEWLRDRMRPGDEIWTQLEGEASA